jgi:hypothetical protein
MYSRERAYHINPVHRRASGDTHGVGHDDPTYAPEHGVLALAAHAASDYNESGLHFLGGTGDLLHRESQNKPFVGAEQVQGLE